VTTDVDVVVAGAGGAGLVAALRAARAGASVAVVENRESFRRGNNTSMSTAMIPAAGSRWQRDAAISDTATCFIEDIQRKTHGSADAVTVEALVNVAPLLVEWLADDLGLPLELVTDFVYPGHSFPRLHSLPDRAGSSLLGALLAAVEATTAIDLIMPMRLRGIGTDARGAVVAAVIEDPSGGRETVPTSAVVLATGGFGANESLVSAHIPEISDGLYFGGDGCTGDALVIGEELGATTGFLDAYQGHGSVAVPHNVLVTWATVMHGAVIVNRDGHRFDDETTGYSEFARKILDQPGGDAWLLLDERIDGLCRGFKDYQDLLSQGGVRWATDVEELAGGTGLPDTALLATIADVGRRASEGDQDVFGRSSFSELRWPIGWVRITGALFHTQGGLLVDGHARVQRGSEPIPGLYAAGGAAAGISGHGADGYLAGNGLLAALGLGLLAGDHAGAHALSQQRSGT